MDIAGTYASLILFKRLFIQTQLISCMHDLDLNSLLATSYIGVLQDVDCILPIYCFFSSSILVDLSCGQSLLFYRSVQSFNFILKYYPTLKKSNAGCNLLTSNMNSAFNIQGWAPKLDKFIKLDKFPKSREITQKNYNDYNSQKNDPIRFGGWRPNFF